MKLLLESKTCSDTGLFTLFAVQTNLNYCLSSQFYSLDIFFACTYFCKETVFRPDIIMSLPCVCQSGSTALHRAANNGRTECVSLLLRAGADLDIRNNVSNRCDLRVCTDCLRTGWKDSCGVVHEAGGQGNACSGRLLLFETLLA